MGLKEHIEKVLKEAEEKYGGEGVEIWLVWEKKPLETNLVGAFTSEVLAENACQEMRRRNGDNGYYWDVGTADVIGGFHDVGWNFG